MTDGELPPNMALQRTRRPRIRSGRSLRSLGSPLNARPLDAVGKAAARRSPRRPESAASSPSGARAVHSSRLGISRAGWRQRPPRSMIRVVGENGAFTASASSSARV
jgi:hypothetical protein